MGLRKTKKGAIISLRIGVTMFFNTKVFFSGVFLVLVCVGCATSRPKTAGISDAEFLFSIAQSSYSPSSAIHLKNAKKYLKKAKTDFHAKKEKSSDHYAALSAYESRLLIALSNEKASWEELTEERKKLRESQETLKKELNRNKKLKQALNETL